MHSNSKDPSALRPLPAGSAWHRLAIGLAAPLALVALTACGDRDDVTPVAPATAVETPAATEGGTTAGASGDPSVPATPSAVQPGAVDGAQDSAATAPESSMTPKEESESMPEAGQANNHSSTAMDDEKK